MLTPDFSKSPDGLIPAIIQDFNTDTVLMLGYMNAAALATTQKEGKVTFFSRTKNRLWTKGETTSHFLLVKTMALDCDNDTILIKAIPQGATCHTGADTCWNEKNEEGNFLFHLERVIADRKNNPSESSYTSKLLARGINKVAQKVGEEAVELVIEAKDDNKDLFLGEAADLMYHYLVLLQAKNYSLSEVIEVLKKRHS
jgi:phosphoribosyl-AMP cyclohydrolase / phosphoribosyl-ATP pyrophosphohydrolase